MYNFNNETDVETAVNELAAAANNGELYIIADEAYHYDEESDDDDNNTSGRFSEFVTHLSNRVPSLHLWAAAVDRVRVPPCVSVETLTRPLRCPPAIVTEIEKSRDIDGNWPEDCERCADNIVNLLVELRVGQSGHLQYRDTVILCDEPRDNPPVVSRLRARGLPVQVVTLGDDEAAIRDVALAQNDTIMSDPPRDALYIRAGFAILTLVNRMSVKASIILIFTIVINSSFIINN
nr:hypothetical protein BaRGS_033834 [Batillaria attramentaria]